MQLHICAHTPEAKHKVALEEGVGRLGHALVLHALERAVLNHLWRNDDGNGKQEREEDDAKG